MRSRRCLQLSLLPLLFLSSAIVSSLHLRHVKWPTLSRALPGAPSRRKAHQTNMCGVLGVVLADKDAAVAQDLYDGLTLLQHRGQDAAGMATCDGAKVHLRKDRGLVREVLNDEAMGALRGAYGVGHVRYRTAGGNSAEEAQPFFGAAPLGFCLAHNGHLTNGRHLRDQLSAACHLNTDSDSELLAQLLGQLLLAARQARSSSSSGSGGSSAGERQRTILLNDSDAGLLTLEEIFAAVKALMSRCRGGFAVTVALVGVGVLAFRDPHGIRPLALGSRAGGGASGKLDWAVASESGAFAPLGFSLRRDVGPGEAVLIDLVGAVHSRRCGPVSARSQFRPCLFEYVYMARPDSVLDGVAVHQARTQMGIRLAGAVAAALAPLSADEAIDVVVPVPDTSRIAALHCAQRLGVPYEEGLTKTNFAARSFLLSGAEKRRREVRRKLSPVASVLAGKRVLLVDDSIVRGTTSKHIISMVRAAGAAAVFFASAAPAVRHANVYGIDLPTQSELVAFGLREEDVADAIGADRVIYLGLEELSDAVRCLNPAIDAFEDSMFSGDYVCGDGDGARARAALLAPPLLPPLPPLKGRPAAR